MGGNSESAQTSFLSDFILEICLLIKKHFPRAWKQEAWQENGLALCTSEEHKQKTPYSTEREREHHLLKRRFFPRVILIRESVRKQIINESLRARGLARTEQSKMLHT